MAIAKNILQSKQDTPLDRLNVLLAQEMAQVNDIILKEMHSDVALIPQLAGYLVASGGKRIRPLMTLASAALFEDKNKRAANLAATVEFIHTATLLHDDVVDESNTRRGQDSANALFGNQASVLVGDFLFSRAFQLMVRDGSLDVLRILSSASAVIAEGEVMQLSTTGNLETSIDDYLLVIESKTAALFAAACEIGPIIAFEGDQKSLPQAKIMRDYGTYLGMAFQIIDDVLDYSSNREKLGKTIGDDFREGKITLPVLMSMSGDNHDFWHRVLVKKDQRSDDFKKALEIMSASNALDKSVAHAKLYAQKARETLAQLPTQTMDNRQAAILHALSDLCDFTVSREY